MMAAVIKSKLFSKIIKIVSFIFSLAIIQSTLSPAIVSADVEDGTSTQETSVTTSSEKTSELNNKSSSQSVLNKSFTPSSSAMSSSLNSSSLSSSSNKTVKSSNGDTDKKTRATAPITKVDPTNISSLVTNGYALGAASNFNLFATNTLKLSGNAPNARIGANTFNGTDSQVTLGWTTGTKGDDTHMLVANTLQGTYGTKFATSKTTGIYAAESSTAPALKNTNGEDVDPDSLNAVTDFSRTGISSFSQTSEQLQSVSDFYASTDQVTKVFSDKFVKIVDLTDSDMISQKGIDKTITDSGTHQFLIVNIPATSEDQLKYNGYLLHVSIKYITKTVNPIVILNFPNLKTLSLEQADDLLNVSYGANEANQTSITDKSRILMNFPNASDLSIQQNFVGTLLAPAATVLIKGLKLNTTFSAAYAKNIEMTNGTTSSGSDGVFNPPEFGDPNNQGGSTETDEITKADVTKVPASGSASTKSFKDNQQTLSDFKYNDTLKFDIGWQGYADAELYRSTDGTTWTNINADVKTGDDGNKTYTSADFSPGKDVKLTVDGSNGTQQIFKTTGNKTYSFALVKSNQKTLTDVSDAVWQGQVATSTADFTLAVPDKIDFSIDYSKLTTDSDGDLLATPKQTPELVLSNDLEADFSLTLKSDATADQTEPKSEQTNVFLGAQRFKFISNNQAIYLANNLELFNKSVPIDGVLAVAQDPLEPKVEKYQLTGFEVKVPLMLASTAATVGLDWQLNLDE